MPAGGSWTPAAGSSGRIHVTNLLRTTLVQERPAEVDELVIESVLVATESIITFRRRHSVRAGASSVLELVLLDRDNPRSVAYQVDRLQEDLSAVSVGRRFRCRAGPGCARPGHGSRAAL